MKLYEIPRGSSYRILDFPEKIYRLERIDGMYSVSYNEDNELVHISASVEVEIV